MKIFEKSYIRVVKASRFLMSIVRSGVPELLLIWEKSKVSV